jgi:HEAT repeat
MRKGKLVLVVMLSAALGAAVLLMLLPKPEPSYQGKRLSEWLASLDNPPGAARWGAPGWSDNWSHGNGKAVGEALHHMGTNVVAPLRQMINHRDHSWKLKWVSWCREWGLLRFRVDDEWVGHYRAATACRLADAEVRTQLLGDWIRLLLDKTSAPGWYDNDTCFCFSRAAIGKLSPAACEVLVAATTNRNTQLHRYVVMDLKQFRSSETEKVTSALLNIMRNDSDNEFQLDAVQILRQMPPIIVPALAQGLSDNSASTRRGCLMALTSFTNEASVIVPAILKKMDDPDPSVRSAATNALKTISVRLVSSPPGAGE